MLVLKPIMLEPQEHSSLGGFIRQESFAAFLDLSQEGFDLTVLLMNPNCVSVWGCAAVFVCVWVF